VRVLIDAAGTRYSWPRINHKLKDHSKLMIVDEHWVLLGSANWDVRSLRLNFELNVEAYGRHFAEEMGQVIQNKLRAAREVTLAEVEGRSYPAKLRDSIARLFSPYL